MDTVMMMRVALVAAITVALSCNGFAQWNDRNLGGLRGVAIGKIGGPVVKNGEGSIVVLKDGRLLHAFTRHEANRDIAPGVIAQTESSDDGVTWSEPKVLFTSTTGNNAMQPGFVRMKNGELGISYSRIDSLSAATKVFRFSDDEGKTWSKEILISPEGSYWTSAHDRMLLLSTGRIVIPLHHKTAVRPEQMTTQVAYSDDNGRTWSLSSSEVTSTVMLPEFAKKFSERSAPGFWEASIVELNGGKLLMIGRTYAGVQYRSTSTDHGVHWSKSEPTTIPSAATPARLVSIPGSHDLLVLWNSCCIDQSDSLVGPRLTLSSAISSDEGATWKLRRDIEAISPAKGNRVEYPTVTFDKGEAFITYRVQTIVNSESKMQEYLAVLPIDWFFVGSLGRQ